MFLHCTFYKCLELLFASEFSTRKIYRYFCSDDSCLFSLYHYPPWKSTISSRWESPPPMRGKGRRCWQLYRRAGITPAYAGKRVDLCTISSRSKDHPRLCGEKRNHFTGDCINGGSPPPMRGKGNWRCRRLSGCGITPAYAGKREIAGIVFSEN